MSRLVWDQEGERTYETGTKKTVLYPQATDGTYGAGVAWSGVSAITESPSGAEATKIYADDIKYLSLMSAEELGLTVEAYTYPDEFKPCDGSVEAATGVVLTQQSRQKFGLCYRTILGNDTKLDDYAYKLHIVYGCLASPSEKSYESVSDSPEAITLSWDVDTTPVEVTGYKPTSMITIDSSICDPDALASLEDILYGTDETEAKLPLPDEIVSLFGGSKN